MTEVKYFKGDVIYRAKTETGMDTKMQWGIDLIGVRENIKLNKDSFVLFHRPFRNYFKSFCYKFYIIMIE